MVVSPLQTSVGNDMDLEAVAVDADDDPIDYMWTATGGSIADPTEVSTTYTCEEVGDHVIEISVSDDGFDYCIDVIDVDVTCVPN